MTEEPTDQDQITDHPYQSSEWPDTCGYGVARAWPNMCGASMDEHAEPGPTPAEVVAGP